MSSQVVSVSANLGPLLDDIAAMSAQAPIILMRGLNKAGAIGKTAMVRAVATDTGIRMKDVHKVIRTAKATPSRLMWDITLKGKRIPLIAFGARGPEPSRGRGRGVTWKSVKGEKKRVKDFFIATVGTGKHRGVFQRMGTSSRKSSGAWSLNLPIAEKFGPSIPHVAEKKVPVFDAAANAALERSVLHEIKWASSVQAALRLIPF